MPDKKTMQRMRLTLSACLLAQELSTLNSKLDTRTSATAARQLHFMDKLWERGNVVATPSGAFSQARQDTELPKGSCCALSQVTCVVFGKDERAWCMHG